MSLISGFWIMYILKFMEQFHILLTFKIFSMNT